MEKKDLENMKPVQLEHKPKLHLLINTKLVQVVCQNAPALGARWPHHDLVGSRHQCQPELAGRDRPCATHVPIRPAPCEFRFSRLGIHYERRTAVPSSHSRGGENATHHSGVERMLLGRDAAEGYPGCPRLRQAAGWAYESQARGSHQVDLSGTYEVVPGLRVRSRQRSRGSPRTE